jgi:hypothetical protein
VIGRNAIRDVLVVFLCLLSFSMFSFGLATAGGSAYRHFVGGRQSDPAPMIVRTEMGIVWLTSDVYVLEQDGVRY